MNSTISGLYRAVTPAGSRPGEQFRLDVDGYYPQMAASGVVFTAGLGRTAWMAKLRSASGGGFSGSVLYRHPAALSGFPYTTLQIKVRKASTPSEQPEIRVTFRSAGFQRRTVTYQRVSAAFDTVVFEYDHVEGITPVTSFDTGSHPNRPPGLPVEDLSIKTVYERSGFDVQVSGASPVPLAGAGANQAWNDTEMHDAMQTAWSRNANIAQWAMWVFFANQYEDPDTGQPEPGMGGIMFDSIGRERQGTAIFYDSFISELPPGDPNAAAYVARMRFWTAVHEMGHAFNLLHSWQKALGTPWFALANEPEARSFMNYPYRVIGKVPAFFADFEYRFTDNELLFLRHAPRQFVQMGNAAFASSHGFEEARVSPAPDLALVIRFNRPKPIFEFMEPVVAEVKLTNVSRAPQIVDQTLLSNLHELSFMVQKDGGPAREYHGFATYCREAKPAVLQPGDSLYSSVYLAAGANGVDLAEPGYYTIKAMLTLEHEDIVSAPVRVRIAPPKGYDDEYVAQDFFCEDVARVMNFDGSRVLDGANDTLREVAGRLKGSAVARHAGIALAMPLRVEGKVLDLAGGAVRKISAKPAAAQKELSSALLSKPAEAAETLGHVDFKYYVDRLTDLLASEGDSAAAREAQQKLLAVFEARKVKPRVLEAIRRREESYGSEGRKRKKK
jgi:hypothetical protein